MSELDSWASKPGTTWPSVNRPFRGTRFTFPTKTKHCNVEVWRENKQMGLEGGYHQSQDKKRRVGQLSDKNFQTTSLFY